MLPYQPASIINMTFEIDSFYLLSLYAPKYHTRAMPSSAMLLLQKELACVIMGNIMLLVFLIHDRVP
jgi:hypothetical protein